MGLLFTIEYIIRKIVDRKIKGNAGVQTMEHPTELTAAQTAQAPSGHTAPTAELGYAAGQAAPISAGQTAEPGQAARTPTEQAAHTLTGPAASGVYTISTFTADSRPDGHILCYEGNWSAGQYRTWRDFLIDTAKMRKVIGRYEAQEWLVHCEDYWYFLVTFVALLQCRKTVKLTQNITEGFLREIKTPGTCFLTDQETAPASSSPLSIPALIAEADAPAEAEFRTTPAFRAEDTNILMYTSGSTGQPKAVAQRMKEFELDNAFIISKWGQEFRTRKLVTTVSQHHIYGFLFGISLPFALGVPFRRTRIELPGQFQTLSDERYMIIATPAFLKRTVESESALPLHDCFIFTSGGVLTPETARQTDKLFGFWPVEVYGSTETSGIAWRQSKNGLHWTPFDNAKIWKNDAGCLVIVSPYIKDPAGFATNDLVDILDDGSFILKGRSDSIVKIEEKRISLTEVENRLLASGLVADVKVIAMEDRRQYLAAAVVLNAQGRECFGDQPKLVLNKFFHNYLMQFFENVTIPKKWRFPDSLPTDVQGKKRREDIAALFTQDSGAAGSAVPQGNTVAASAGTAGSAIPQGNTAASAGTAGATPSGSTEAADSTAPTGAGSAGAAPEAGASGT
ncbi:MAG: acyl-CoA synthetase [Treponema sp.]|nr:acyl-CoA synthetase [Treponema sp.]